MVSRWIIPCSILGLFTINQLRILRWGPTGVTKCPSLQPKKFMTSSRQTETILSVPDTYALYASGCFPKSAFGLVIAESRTKLKMLQKYLPAVLAALETSSSSRNFAGSAEVLLRIQECTSITTSSLLKKSNRPSLAITTKWSFLDIL